MKNELGISERTKLSTEFLIDSVYHNRRGYDCKECHVDLSEISGENTIRVCPFCVNGVDVRYR